MHASASWSFPSFKRSSALLPILAVYVLVTVAVPASHGDEPAFLAYATNLTHGFFAQLHSPSPAAYLWHGPGLPALLAPLVAIHAPLTLIRILVGPVLIFATMVVFDRLAALHVGERGALIATYALALLYLPFFIVVVRVRVEPLVMLCLMLATLFVVRSARGGRRDHVWAGAALALLALSRPEFGDVLVACLFLSSIWLLFSRKSVLARRSLITIALALLLCTPWLVYTYSLTGRLFYWGNSGGSALYWMTAPGSLGDWQSQNAVFTNPHLALDRPVFAEVDRLKPLDQDSRLWHIALQNIEHHPTHYLSNVVNNIGRLVFNSPYSFTRQTACSMFYAVPNALLLGLLSLATFCAIRVRRRLPPEIIPIAVFVGLGFAIHIPLAASVRYGIPLVPVAVWLVVAVMATYIRVFTESRRASGTRHPGPLAT